MSAPVTGRLRPVGAAQGRDVDVDGARQQPRAREDVDRALLGVLDRPAAVEGVVDGDVVEPVDVRVQQAVAVEDDVVLPPAHAVVGRHVPGLVDEARPLRRRVVVVAAQRAGEAHRLPGADQRRRPRPRRGVDEVGRPAAVVLAEGAGRQARVPTQAALPASIGCTHIVVLF